MRAMILEQQGQPLVEADLPAPKPGPGQVRVKVSVCGVCRTDLHVLDGELAAPKLPLVMGHQIVGTVDELGEGVDAFSPEPPVWKGDRVGVPWLGGACGRCAYCQEGRENLCDDPSFTGYQIDGGFAEYCVVDADFCFRIPENYPDLQAAPLLCAGLIGYRAYRMAGAGTTGLVYGERLGFYGFGAAAHILCQVAKHDGRKVYAFTSPGDAAAQDFARKLGAVWAGGSGDVAPEELDAAIIFAPVGALVPVALRAVRKGGTVVCAGIHMSDIPSFPYNLLWGERVIRSVANLTRKDGEDFLALAPTIPIKTEVTPYPLERVNDALEDLRRGRFTGAAVINVMD